MPDAAQLQVVNQALGHLGQEPVLGLDTDSLDTSVAAQKVLRFADAARDAVLAEHGWTCALEYADLPLSVLPGSRRWPAIYLLPGDALRVWSVGGWGEEFWREPWFANRWQVGSIDTDLGARRVIRSTDTVGPCETAYVRRAAWGALDTHVRDAVAGELAARAAYSVTGDQNRADKLAPRAKELLMIAVSVDGTQQSSPVILDFVTDRLRRSCG